MTEDEQQEIARIITQALFTYRAPKGGDRHLARGKHITHTLQQHGWVLMKDKEDA